MWPAIIFIRLIGKLLSKNLKEKDVGDSFQGGDGDECFSHIGKDTRSLCIVIQRSDKSILSKTILKKSSVK